ncbi:hypothetical protein AB0L65_16985 [Nonomuraea sp. NPDC052116]|uniref:hypothetical protein n=1 Tax=Nonomuraea sp. NPDC052116 TaxID=3155665 RepID=UPI0034127883
MFHDGVGLPPEGIVIHADETPATAHEPLARGAAAEALAVLEEAIVMVRWARRAVLLKPVDGARLASFDFDGYLAELHCRRARVRLADDELDAAHSDLSTACLLVPRHELAGPLLVEVYERMGWIELAISRLSRMYRADSRLGLAMLSLVANAHASAVSAATVAPAFAALRERDPEGLSPPSAGGRRPRMVTPRRSPRHWRPPSNRRPRHTWTPAMSGRPRFCCRL